MDTFRPEDWPRVLNLGCGFDKRPECLNIDLHASHEPDLVADVRSLPMLPTGYYDGAVAQDVLEHLTREDAPAALREWARVVKVGGFLELRVPNLLGLAVLLSRRTKISQQKLHIQFLFGTQAYTGDFHLNGYTEILLLHELREAGFGQVEITSRDEWLFDVRAIRMEEVPGLDRSRLRFMHLGLPSVGAPRTHRTAAPLRSAPRPSGQEDLRRWLADGTRLGRRALGKAGSALRRDPR